MRTRLGLAAAAVVGATLATPARAEVKSLNGQTPPDLSWEQASGDKIGGDLKSLKGKVVMLEIFATW